jgi:SSS family solute:Na+ symporter
MLITFIPIYIIVTLAIGFWASKRIKTAKDFTLAGRSLSTSIVGVTIFATWFGASNIMGNPGHFIERGVAAFVTNIFSGSLCLAFIGFFYIKKLYRMNISTVGDFIRIRYNKQLDLAISTILILTYFPWIASQFVALAFLFNAVLGISLHNGILLSALIVVIYTYVGGMWAVSYTDMLQSVLILVGLVILLVNVLNQTGGISPLFTDKPKDFFSIFPKDGLENWSEYIALWLAFFIGATPVQEIYQRAFSAKTEKAAVNGVYLSALLLLIIPIIPLIIGLAAVQLHPELINIDSGQSLIPAMVSAYSSMPIQVLFYGALISAILSTSSGAMLAPATIIGENLLKPYLPNLTDKHLLLWTRISVVIVAIISCIFAFNDSDIIGLVVASLSLVLVCIFAPFTFGFFWKKASIFGAWSAIIIGGLTWFLCYIFETQIDPTIYGTPASCVAMIAGSLIRPDGSKQIGNTIKQSS